MGASAKRKKEKKKDFQVSGLFSPFGLFEVLIREDEQKPKLKVGKTRPKASNFTDTSFQSKGELSRSLGREGERHWSVGYFPGRSGCVLHSSIARLV